MACHQTNYYFLDGRKDTSPGILVIDQRWQFVLNKSNRENRAESTRLQKSQLTTSLVEDSSCQSIEDLPSRKRKFGTCNRSNTKRLKYRFYQ